MGRCVVCLEVVDGGNSCADGHFLCSSSTDGHLSCAARHVEHEIQNLRENRGRVPCVDRSCQHTLDWTTVLAEGKVPARILAGFITALGDASITALPPGSGSAGLLRIPDALNRKCPHCRVVIHDFDGCAAVRHVPFGCGRYFCGLCLKPCRGAFDSHAHVRSLHGHLYPSSSSIEQWSRWTRIMQVRTALHDCTEQEKEVAFERLRQMFADLTQNQLHLLTQAEQPECPADWRGLLQPRRDNQPEEGRWPENAEGERAEEMENGRPQFLPLLPEEERQMFERFGNCCVQFTRQACLASCALALILYYLLVVGYFWQGRNSDHPTAHSLELSLLLLFAFVLCYVSLLLIFPPMPAGDDEPRLEDFYDPYEPHWYFRLLPYLCGEICGFLASRCCRQVCLALSVFLMSAAVAADVAMMTGVLSQAWLEGFPFTSQERLRVCARAALVFCSLLPLACICICRSVRRGDL